MKKLLSMLLAVVMVIGLIGPVIAVEETKYTASVQMENPSPTAITALEEETAESQASEPTLPEASCTVNYYEDGCTVTQNQPKRSADTDSSGDVSDDVAPALDITLLTTQLNVSSMCGQTAKDSYIDEETGEEVHSPEYTYYGWANHCVVSAVIDGETYENVRLYTLADACSNNTGVLLSGGIIHNQSYDNQWQVGGSYPVTYYIFEVEGQGRILWSVELTITICEPSPKIQVSDITVDELSGYMDGEVMFYRWEEQGRMDVTIDDRVYEGISMMQLQALMENEYGYMSYLINAAGDRIEDVEKLWDPYENPWTVGDEMYALLTIYGGEDKSLLFNDVICVRLCQTRVESVTIAPITYYVHDYSGDPVITVHYKDGTSEVTDTYSCSALDEWPREPGDYTMDFLVANTFTVTAQITALPTPHSGSLGDTVTWVYDAQTDTMTLSGSGTAVYGRERPWTRLFMSLAPRKIVVSEGIEYLQEGIFHYGLFVEELVLPTSLKEAPLAMIGFNGPTSGTYLEEEYGILPGMTSIAIPEGITSLTNYAFYQCWGITDIYLPATLEQIDLDVICSNVKLREDMGLAPVDMTIHFAGTQAQWDAVAHVAGDYRTDLGSGMTDEELEEMFAGFTLICKEEDAEYDPAVMDLSGDGKVTAFDAQILAEAKAGLRTLTETQWTAIGSMAPEDILNYILGK